MSLINCGVNLILTWSSTCVITNSIGVGTFAKIDTKLYVPVVTLSAQDNAKLVKELKSSFKRINPSFQEVNRFFVLSFENETDKTSHSGYYLSKV